MSFLKSENFIRRGLPAFLLFMSIFAIIEIGSAGYLVGRGDAAGNFGMSIRSKLRFSLFTGLWQLVFGVVVAAGIWRRLRVINSGFFAGIFLLISFIFWLAAAAAITDEIRGSNYPYGTTLRTVQVIAWIEAIFTLIAIAWTFAGVSHAKEGIRGSVAA